MRNKNNQNIGDIPSGNWHFENINDNLIQAEKYSEILWESTTKYQTAKIIEGLYFGRSLILDGKTQSTTSDEFIYHESLVHPSLVQHQNPENIFIAGGGEGATAREVLKYKSIKNITMVDIDKEVVLACKKLLKNHHKNSFDNPKVNLTFGDARNYLKFTKESYDVVIIDVPDPLEAGPAYKLFTKEFYSLVKSKLKNSGILVTQAGPTDPNSAKQWFTKVFNTINSVFPLTLPYHSHVPAFGTTWGFVMGSNSDAPSTTEEIDLKLKQLSLKDLSMYDGIAHDGLFNLPKYLRASLYNETHVINDNDPLFVD